ncbi:hypothetical protein TUBRATIS_16020 [Tubulinosema ratisbonensis]|uniref:Uncharacterized protein n=1 Tax=Tubulinosema ratisbonensis TaxID=291195 RepID=A0A437AL45_9MICR|nr:hypothetical protein TUBRATIS_16020 [Tubulinosema ratisbonensis]
MYSLVYLLCTIKIEMVLLSHNINLRNKSDNNNVSCLKKIKKKKKILTKKDKKVILENMYTEFNKVKKVHLKKDRISLSLACFIMLVKRIVFHYIKSIDIIRGNHLKTKQKRVI